MSRTVSVTCNYCGNAAEIASGAFNRARKIAAPLYCNRTCSGMGRRKNKTPEQKTLEKAVYDSAYREKNRESRKARKAAYYKQTADRNKEREYRKASMPRHVEYCRQPKYKEWKVKYDRAHLAKKNYGDFAEAALLLRDIETEVLSRASRYDIDLANGQLGKVQKRKREYAKIISG